MIIEFESCDMQQIKHKSRARIHAACNRAQLDEWVCKPWLQFGKCFPNGRLGWLVYKTQHLPIYIHLQAVAYKRGWLKYESCLSDFFSRQK